MSGCQFHSRISAYHDGELDQAASKAIELHLHTCEECTEELESLRQVTSAMADFDPGQMTPIELARLHRELDRADEGSLVRFTVGLIGMAASVLIISLAWIGQPTTQPTRTSSNLPQVLPQWQRLALGEPLQAPYIHDESGVPIPETGVAKGPDKDTIEWMLSGLQGPMLHESR